jgi:hypothetical protein
MPAFAGLDLSAYFTSLLNHKSPGRSRVTASDFASSITTPSASPKMPMELRRLSGDRGQSSELVKADSIRAIATQSSKAQGVLAKTGAARP